MATRIKLTDLERRILERLLLAGDGYEPVEELLMSLDADRNQFVDALETLEAEGCLSVSSLGGSIMVTTSDPIGDAILATGGPVIYANRVGHC